MAEWIKNISKFIFINEKKYLINLNLIFFIFMNLLIISDTFFNILISDTLSIFIFFTLHFLTIILIQYLVISICTDRFKIFAISLSLTLNLIIFKLSNYEIFIKIFYLANILLGNLINLPFRILQIETSTPFLLGQLIFVILLSVIFIFLIKTLSIKKIYLLFSIITLSFIVSLYLNNTSKNKIQSDYQVDNLPTFSKKPNIYLIGVDGLAPFKILNSYFENKLFFPEFIESNILRIKNGYSLGRTWKTWPSILTLGEEQINYDIRAMFSGKINTTLFKIFKNNGYKIFTGFDSAYFGFRKGEYIDDLLVEEFPKPIACLNSSKIIGIPRFYGFCNENYHEIYSKLFLENNYSFNYEDQILDKIRSNYNPTLFLYHTMKTRHTSGGFNYKDKNDVRLFEKYYRENFLIISDFIESFIKKVRQYDNDAIVLFFGDHGIWFYQSEWSDGNIETFYNKKYINDWYASQIFFLKTSNECATDKLDYISEYNIQYSVIAGIINCLSENKSFMDDFQKKTMIHKGLPINRHDRKYLNLKEYLYE